MDEAEVKARYARSSGLSKRARIALGTAGVLALTAVVSVFGLRQASPALTATVLGYHVDSDHQVAVKFQVDNQKASHEATCTLRARAYNGDEVGRVDVPVPSGPHTQTLTATLRTSSRAISGEVVDCKLS